LQRGVGIEQFIEVGLEHLRFGVLAVADGPLGQAHLEVVGEDVEYVKGVAVGVMSLLAGLAIDGRGQRDLRVQQRPQPVE